MIVDPLKDCVVVLVSVKMDPLLAFELIHTLHSPTTCLDLGALSLQCYYGTFMECCMFGK